MQKECVVLNGKVINIGPWDYQYEEVELTPAVVDEETNETLVEAVITTVAQNPFPEGAIIETREFEFSEEHGWYEVGNAPIQFDYDQYLLDLEFRISMIEIGGV